MQARRRRKSAFKSPHLARENDDQEGEWSRDQLEQMDEKFRAACQRELGGTALTEMDGCQANGSKLVAETERGATGMKGDATGPRIDYSHLETEAEKFARELRQQKKRMDQLEHQVDVITNKMQVAGRVFNGGTSTKR